MTDPSSAAVRSTTDATFASDVIDRSRELPVVVDFWAAWCGPCRTLAPLLERLVAEFDGQIALVKADTDECPAAAQAFGVSGIPAVYALRDGQLIDQFVGLLPEDQLRQWLTGLLPSDIDLSLREAKSLVETDPAAAEPKFRAVLESEPNSITARVGLGRALLAQRKFAECHEVLDPFADRGLLDEEGEEVLAQLAVAEQAQASGDPDELARKLEGEPDNLAVRLELGQALAGRGDHEAALKQYLECVRNDAGGPIGEKAREHMVQVFQVLGEQSPLTTKFRRKLSLALY